MAPKKKPSRGLLVTFEGIDGCGKTTQLRLARRFLVAQGRSVAVLREPGSTPVAERIRRLLLDRRSSMSHVTELLLYEAARCEITRLKIAPLLEAGRVVLCDRFYDSTTAYQGYGRGIDVALVARLHRLAVGPIRPDLTFVFDIDPATARSRLGRRLDRLESQAAAFHRRVRRGFLEIARREPRRVKVIDGTGPVDQVFEEVRRHLLGKLKRP